MGSKLGNIILCLLLLVSGGALHAAKPISNITKFPVLLVEFEDVKFSLPEPEKRFNAMLNGRGYALNGATGSVAEWLNANFAGKAVFSFELSDVITLPNPVAFYGEQSGASSDSNILQLVVDACAAAQEGGMDFSAYDNDGDGMADNVSIIFAGYSQAEGGDSGSIWPHQQNIAGMDISCGDTGIASYTCTAELAGSSGTSIAPIGHFCHEFSHFLGLQDLYDTNGEEEGTAPGTYGTLSIMDRGNFLNGGNTPPLFNAVERELLGICTVEDLLPGRSYTLEPATRNGKVYRIGTSNEGEYFLLECRRNVGWDSHIGGSGLVVYHVDKSTRVYGGIASADRWKFNNINCFAEHECVRVISASGVSDKAGGVFFPGQAGVRELGPSGGKMPLRCWAGHPVGIGIEAISYSGGKVSLRTVEERSFSPSLPRVAGCTAIPYQNDIRVWWLPQAPDMENVEGLERLVEWREKDSGADYSSMVTPVRGCLIQGVVPGCTYEIQVRAFKDNVYGEGSRLIARSIPITSAFPYIYVDAKGYQEGEEMDLRIVNLVEKHVGVEWFVDGMPVDGTSFLPESAGEVEIMALIFYSDGSNERIYKRIQVK